MKTNKIFAIFTKTNGSNKKLNPHNSHTISILILLAMANQYNLIRTKMRIPTTLTKKIILLKLSPKTMRI